MTGERITSLRVAELFAGVGGFRLGLESAGHKVVFSNQWEPSTKIQHASSAYVANFGEAGHTCIDIARIEKFPEPVDLIVGGFPCQDYSVAKSASASSGIEGKKGVLWWEIHRLVDGALPPYIFLENVDRLLKSPSSQRGRDFAIMLKSLGDLGYAIEWRIINAADYGFPQRRKRVLIFATKVSELRGHEPESVLREVGVLAQAFPGAIEPHTRELEISDSLLEISSGFNKRGGRSPFLSSGYYCEGRALTANFLPLFEGEKLSLGDVLQNEMEVSAEFYVGDSQLPDWEYLKGAKQIERSHKESGFKYKYSEGKMAFPDALNSPSRTILTAEGGSSPSRFKHIIKVDGRHRRLTPVELERLNGFPDDWTKFDHEGKEISVTKRAFFMGNALVVGLVERVADVLATRRMPT